MAYTLVPTELIVDGAITSAKLDTNIAISGTLGVTGEVTLATHLIMGDNDKIKIGTGGDLEIYHDGSNSYISNSTGNIYLGDTNGAVHIQAKLNEESIICAADGAVTLHHDNSPKLATTSTGINVTGNVESDSVTIGVGAVATTEKLRVNGTVLTLGGSVSTPAIGIGDTNTGIYAPTAGQLGWTVNGTQRLFLDSTGIDVTGTVVADGLTVDGTGTFNNNGNENLFLADTANTTRSSLQVGGALTYFNANIDSASHGIFAWRSSNAFTERMRIDSSGNVGIGNSSPSSFNAAGTGIATVSGTGTGASTLALYSGTTSSGFLYFSDGTTGANRYQGYVEYSHNNNDMRIGTAGTERMRIDSSGNVRVGVGNTFEPTIQFTNSGRVASNPAYSFNGDLDTGMFNPSTQGTIAFSNNGTESMRITSSGVIQSTNGTTTGEWYPSGGVQYFGTSTNHPIQFFTNSSNAMRITSDGVLQINAVARQTMAEFNNRQNGAVIEFGHENNGGQYYGTLGVFGTNGHPYIGFSTDCESSADTFTTRGVAGNIITGDIGNGSLKFMQVTSSSATGQTPVERMRIVSDGGVGIGQTSPYSNASFTSLSIGGTSGKAGLTEYKYNNDVSKGYLYAQSAAVTLESAGTNLIRFATNAAFRGAIDSKGTLFYGAGDSSYAHNTYAHAAVFSKNSTPLGTVVIEDSDVSSGVGNTVLNCYLRDQDPATLATFIKFTDGGGTVGSITHNDDGGGVTYNTTSDYRLKENINYDWDALSLLNQLKPAKFNFIRQPSKTLQGFLAHEVKDIVPSSVQGDKDHMMDIGTITHSNGDVIYEGVYEHFCKTDEGQTWTKTGEEPLYQELDYSRIVPLLTKAIQEQQTIIDDLKSRIETLEG